MCVTGVGYFKLSRYVVYYYCFFSCLDCEYFETQAVHCCRNFTAAHSDPAALICRGTYV